MDKIKAGAISIQTDGKLKIFKDHMWDLLIPPVLAIINFTSSVERELKYQECSDGSQ